MLREIKSTSQKQNEPDKRWFSSPGMDLFIWFDDEGDIVSYQLTYDKPHNEKAIIWNQKSGFEHLSVDDGTRSGRHPGSPLLVPAGIVDSARLVSMLENNSAELDPAIKNFIVSGISE
ncbi:MAG: hypothetical protein GY785_18205 [Gammaproteobacteria bacterium]|nr:hypothetical protein [Gammaproteobacteria bacterium]